MSETRQWQVWATASGYAVVEGKTKKEATENARAGNFIKTPRPAWNAQASDLRELKP